MPRSQRARSGRTTIAALLALTLTLAVTVGAQEPAAPPSAPVPPAPEAATKPIPPAEPEPAAAPADEPAPIETPAPTEAPAPPVPPSPPVEAEEQSATAPSPIRGSEERSADDRSMRRERRSSRGGSGGNFPFGDHYVPAGSRMHDAVSILGSTRVDGRVDGDAVSILGDTRVGPEAEVGGATVAVLGHLDIGGRVRGEAVSVLGGVTIDGRVHGDVVSVLGNMRLGPNAVVDGDIVIVVGGLEKHPDAVVRGNEVRAPGLGGFAQPEWLTTWLERCLMLGRPLAFGEHLGWAWIIAGSFLAFYLLLALIFPRGIEICATTLETRPAYSILASVLTVLLTPVAIILLAVTVIGALLVPFVGAGLMCVGFFGKAVMLAWIGRRFTKWFGDGPLGHPAFAVLIGGVIVLGLYTVPVLGFLLFKLLSWLGLGVVVYTIALRMKSEKAAAVPVANGFAATPSTTVTPPAPAAVGTTEASAAAADAIPGIVPTVPEGVSPGSAGVASFGMEPGGAAMPPPAGTAAAAGAVPAAARPSPISAATMPRASFMLRMGALFLDVVLVGLVLAFSSGLLPRGLRFDIDPPSMLPVLAIYGAVMWKMKGTTIGGIVCGLKVVRIDDREIDWATAIVRALSCFLSLVVAGLGFIWSAIDEDKQAWHDKIAGTVVVRVPKGVSLL